MNDAKIKVFKLYIQYIQHSLPNHTIALNN